MLKNDRVHMTGNFQSGFWSGIQIPIFVLALLCLLIGIFITPELLISLGPMRLSLTSDIVAVRKSAHAEVMLFKILCYFLAFLLTVIAITWKKISGSSFVQQINAHQPMLYAGNNYNLGLFNSSLFTTIGCVILGVLYIALGAHIFNPAQLNIITKEDGIIEYLSVLFLLACCCFAAILAFKFSDNRARRITHTLLALLFFVMAGEEISWGQRLFNIETPEVLENINIQGELNFHNLFGYMTDHMFIAAIFIYGFIMPVISQLTLFSHKFFDYLGIPIASPGLAVGFLVASLHHQWIATLFTERPLGFRIAELRELLVAIALFMLMLESWRLYQNNYSTAASSK